ncbi:hypothetical protein PMAYCL1PPCAC_10960 [Pristionchus mayeri]|uniref:7TM GPCR serpentine receptor class x (Srx) domain-containing protein n=1 Tax=Pristionchus mayeri TaxID=1317129 RepID=A0AAN4ZNC5_9BILA|nr:hypothetical protein PMAYCL1PPCAC_10960 [Pristionchus mayeri]
MLLKVSVFGFITNSIAIITLIKSQKMHTSFGILCGSLATNNIAVLIFNSTWLAVPLYSQYPQLSCLKLLIV